MIREYGEPGFERAVADADSAADIIYQQGDACPNCGPEHRLEFEPPVHQEQEQPPIAAVLWCQNCGCDYRFEREAFETEDVAFSDLRAGDVIVVPDVPGWPPYVTVMTTPEPFPSAMASVKTDQPKALPYSGHFNSPVKVRRRAPHSLGIPAGCLSLVGTIARMILPGEESAEGVKYEQTGEDARDNLIWLITEARMILEGATRDAQRTQR